MHRKFNYPHISQFDRRSHLQSYLIDFLLADTNQHNTKIIEAYVVKKTDAYCVPNKYISDVDARTMYKYPQVCIEMPCGNNAEYLQLCIVTGRWFAASKYLQVCTATSYTGSGVSPSCCGGCTYKCGFRRRMRNRPTDRATIVSNFMRACAQFPRH